MKLYIHRSTGVITAKLNDTSPIQSIPAVLGATLYLDCVFHDGTAAVELAPDATGVCIAKQDKHYSDPALVQALNWTKAQAPEDGYRFVIRPSGAALITLLANQDNVGLMFQIAWSEGEVDYKTPKCSLVVGNAVWRDNEPEIALPEAAWPLPGEWALKSDFTGFSGDLVVGDKTITFLNGLIQSIA